MKFTANSRGPWFGGLGNCKHSSRKHNKSINCYGYINALVKAKEMLI